MFAQAAEAALDLSTHAATCQHLDGDGEGVTDADSQACILEEMRSFRGGDGCCAVDDLLSRRFSEWRSQAAISAARQRLRRCEQELASIREAEETRRPASTAPAPTPTPSSTSCGRLTWLFEGLLSLFSPSPSAFLRPLQKEKEKELLMEAGKVRSNLASLLHRTGRSVEAEQIYKQLLRDHLLAATATPTATAAPDERTDGGRPENHPMALSAAGNLAVLLRAQGRERWAEAESLYRRVLARKTQVLGASHPSTLVTTYNLAALLVPFLDLTILHYCMHALTSP